MHLLLIIILLSFFSTNKVTDMSQKKELISLCVSVSTSETRQQAKSPNIFCLLAAEEAQEMLIAHIAHWLSLNRPTAVHARLTALSENAAQLVHCTLRRNIQDIQDILDTLNIQHPLWQCNPTFKSLHFMHTYAPGILCKLLIKTDIFCPQSKGTSSPIVAK